MRRRGPLALLPAVLAALLAAAPPAHAQYVEPWEESFPDVLYPGIGAGFCDFAPLSSNPTPPGEAIAYTIVMPVVGFTTSAVEIIFGYGRFSTPAGSRETILLSTTIAYDFRLAGGGRTRLVLPVQLVGDFTKAESPVKSASNFNIASTGLGTGLAFRSRSENLEIAVRATQSIQYSSEGFSANNGVAYLTQAEARLIVAGFLSLPGAVFGYRLRYQVWDLKDDRFDARSLMHGPFIGIIL